MIYPPIALFTYARPEHTRRTVEALKLNIGVSNHDLIVYSDAPRSAEKLHAVEAVRDYLKKITGFRTVTINYRSINYGLAKSIIEGVTEVLSRYERVIVLEDDMVTSPYFIKYMHDALDRYANDDRVIGVHGYVYPIQETLPEAFFMRGADCWGWGTWRRGWAFFNPDGHALLEELKQRNLIKEFNYNGTYDYYRMLELQIEGINESWAIRWYASAFLREKLTLYPGRSLVYNIGNDNSGTHCITDSTYDVQLSKVPIDIAGIEIKKSEVGFKSFQHFFLQSRVNKVTRLRRFIMGIFNKAFS